MAHKLWLASEKGLKEYNFKPLARIVAPAVGVEPRIMGIGPVKAIGNSEKAGFNNE